MPEALCGKFKDTESTPLVQNLKATATTPSDGHATYFGLTAGAIAVRLVTCVVALAEGYESAVFGAVATRLEEDLALSPALLGIMASLSHAAIGIGNSTAGFLLNRMGRKPMLFCVCIGLSVSSLLQALAPTSPMFAASRLLLGLFIGAGYTTVTVYVSESSPAPVRGMMVGLEEVFVNVGLFAAFFASHRCLSDNISSWRRVVAMGVPLPLFAAVAILFPSTPESPRYFMLTGRVQEARRTMRALGISSEEAEEVLATWAAERTQGTDRSDEDSNLWSNKNKPAVLLAIGFAFATSMTGIAALHNLMPWALAPSMGEKRALQLASTSTFVKFLVLLPACFWGVDRVGRRPLYLSSAFIYACAAASVALAFACDFSATWTGFLYGLTLCSFSVGMGPVCWPYYAEILPTRVRGEGTGIALMCGRVATVLWMLSFPVVFTWNAAAPFCAMASTATLAFLYYYFLCGETANVPLEQISHSRLPGATHDA